MAHTIASAIEVDPLDASTTTVDGDTSPEAMPCATMLVAIRSLVQPLGSRWSSFSHSVQPVASSSTGTVGVSSGWRSSQETRSRRSACVRCTPAP